MLEERFLKTIACPKCRGVVELKGMFFVCVLCKACYAVIDDVPVMINSESWALKDAKAKNFVHHLKI
ncbi:MAG: Trm112 family protein [Candidatus Aenigmatarchaeota archaeon]